MDMQELQDFLLKEQDENPVLNYVNMGIPYIIRYDQDEDDGTRNIPAQQDETAQDILLSQLDLRNYTKDEIEAFYLIANSVDENGFLMITMEDLSKFFQIPLPLLNRCLTIMRKLDPPGVCSFTIEECLVQQLSAAGNNDELLLDIVQHHLTDIADGKINAIAQALKTSTMRVRHCIQTIKNLNPRPFNGLLGTTAQYIIPDILFSYEKGFWEIELNDKWMGKLEICDYYEALIRKTVEPELQDYLRYKIQRIRFLNDSIEKRRNTLLRIGQCLALHQSDFLLRKGPFAALTMGHVADELGLHPSTVSRAIKGKYLQSPGGVSAMRALFIQGLPSIDVRGENMDVSREEIKERIKKIIVAEDKTKPHSDNTLAMLLKERGTEISRRTVTKYRIELGIKGIHERRYA
jgi:RNA polymerase sigma-54 factor